MNWKIARSLAKLINILFIIFLCIKISFIYKNVYSDEKFSLMGKNNQSGTVFSYDNDNFLYFINYEIEDFSVYNVFDIVESEKGSEKDKSNLFKKIISHRLSLVYLFSIFFGDLVKVIKTLGVL